MSKASQRRQSILSLGRQDVKKYKGRYFRYHKSHPLYSFYREGWTREMRKLHPKGFKFKTFFGKLFKRWWMR